MSGFATVDAPMDRFQHLCRWLTGNARFLGTNTELLGQFCSKVQALAVPLDRSWLHIRTLHPQYGGMTRLWRPKTGIEERYLEHDFETKRTYLTSPIRFAVEERKTSRWRLNAHETLPFPFLDELRADGYCDYVVAPLFYSDGTPNALSWATRLASGFRDEDLQLFDDILPTFSAIAEVKSLRRFATNMLHTYAGREPGELILKGQIRRGDTRTITAALMLVDLRDFTLISDALAPTNVIKMLNRYFDSVMVPIHRHGGEVMEIMGDGILAIFNDRIEGGSTTACRNAFEAAREGIEALAQSNETESDGVIQLVAGFALHHGTVAYGNIGFGNRLDFTVIGREVNVTSRIETLCRQLDRKLIMSGEFVNLLQQPMYEIGHFAMRGILDDQPLFGLPAET